MEFACENCSLFGFIDFGCEEKNCTYYLDPDYDDDGFVLPPPCVREICAK